MIYVHDINITCGLFRQATNNESSASDAVDTELQHTIDMDSLSGDGWGSSDLGSLDGDGHGVPLTMMNHYR